MAIGTLGSRQGAAARIFGLSSPADARGLLFDLFFRDIGMREGLWAQLRERGRLERYELELRRPDGASLDVVASFVGVRDARGKLTEVTGYLFDDTERRRLEGRGFRVLTASGEAAIEELLLCDRPVRAVFLDTRTSRWEQICYCLRLIQPDLGMLITGIYDGENLAGRFPGPGRVRFLPRPYRCGQLLEKLREVLPGP